MSRYLIPFLLSLLFLARCSFFSSEVKTIHSRSYSTSPGSNWQKRDSGEGDESFLLPEGGIVSLNSSCNQNTEYSPELLTRQLLIGARKIQWLSKENFKVKNGTGLLSEVKANYQKSPVQMMIFVIGIEDCVFDLSLIHKKNFSETEKKDFLRYIESFEYGKN